LFQFNVHIEEFLFKYQSERRDTSEIIKFLVLLRCSGIYNLLLPIFF